MSSEWQRTTGWSNSSSTPNRAAIELPRTSHTKKFDSGAYIVFAMCGNITCRRTCSGDIPSVAAASILAKVTRDRFMIELDSHCPGYGFARHKGYGTELHRARLREHGPCPEHRRSFSPVRALL